MSMDKGSGRGCFCVQATLISWSGYTNFRHLHIKMRYFQHLLWKTGIPMKLGQQLFAGVRIPGCGCQNKTSNRKQGIAPKLSGPGAHILQKALNYLQYKTKLSMSSSLTFQDGQSAPSQSQQEPYSLSQGQYSDQRSTQHPTQGEDRDQDSDDKESLAYPNSPPGSPNEQQNSSPLTAIPCQPPALL